MTKSDPTRELMAIVDAECQPYLQMGLVVTHHTGQRRTIFSCENKTESMGWRASFRQREVPTVYVKKETQTALRRLGLFGRKVEIPSFDEQKRAALEHLNERRQERVPGKRVHGRHVSRPPERRGGFGDALSEAFERARANDVRHDGGSSHRGAKIEHAQRQFDELFRRDEAPPVPQAPPAPPALEPPAPPATASPATVDVTAAAPATEEERMATQMNGTHGASAPIEIPASRASEPPKAQSPKAAEKPIDRRSGTPRRDLMVKLTQLLIKSGEASSDDPTTATYRYHDGWSDERIAKMFKPVLAIRYVSEFRRQYQGMLEEERVPKSDHDRIVALEMRIKELEERMRAVEDLVAPPVSAAAMAV